MYIALHLYKTGITTFIKTKLKKSDDQTNIDRYRVAINITDYHITSKSNFFRIIIPKFMKVRKKECQNVQNQHV